MKKFNVHLYFEGSFVVDVIANDEKEAHDRAHEIAAEMSDAEFLEAVDLQYAGYDSYELK